MKNRYGDPLVHYKGLCYSSKSEWRAVAELYCRIRQQPQWCQKLSPEQVMLKMTSEMTNGVGFWFGVNGQPVGFTWGFSTTPEQLLEISGRQELAQLALASKNPFYISELGVAEEFRRQHLGDMLISNLISRARRSGCRQFFLRTYVAAGPARRLYTRLGFHELDIRDNEYGNHTYWYKEV